MANLIKNVNGKKAYIGLLTPEELEEADKLLDRLKEYIPQLEIDLKKKYPNRKDKIYFAHEFGRHLRKLVRENNIKGYQEALFWDQIKEFASKDEDTPKDRRNRKIYDYYYKLSYYSLEDVVNIPWGQWSQLFDIPSVHSNEHVIEWLIAKSKQKKINRHFFRELMPGIRLFAANKDLTVYSKDQLYQKLNMVYHVSYNKEKLDKECNHMISDVRVNNAKKYRERYFKEVYKELRKTGYQNIDCTCENVFKVVYNIK